MEINTIEKIFNFLEEKENKQIPERWFDFKFIDELENHPDDIKYRYEGDLELSHTNITKLPNDLYVDGNLHLFNCKQLTELPIKLYVRGYLMLFGCEQLTKLPDNLYVDGYLNLINSKIKKLPNDLYVTGSLDLWRCKQLTKLPNNLYVGGDFNVADTPLAEKYTDEEIREMITSKGGTLIRKIIR
jgi:hypothetical protein